MARAIYDRCCFYYHICKELNMFEDDDDEITCIEPMPTKVPPNTPVRGDSPDVLKKPETRRPQLYTKENYPTEVLFSSFTPLSEEKRLELQKGLDEGWDSSDLQEGLEESWDNSDDEKTGHTYL
jgi:hypothetical protein